MFDSCRKHGAGAYHCSDVAEKIVQLFGWRQTYKIEKLQRDIVHTSTLQKVQQQKNSASSWLAVHSLQSQADGGLLDPDDRLLDVVDDREQIIANFEDDDSHTRHITGAPPHHAGDRGDGASAGGSSVGSSSAGGNSPDLFMPHMHPSCGQTDIEVTDEQMAAVGLTPLQVRRGSEPALNHLPPPTSVSPSNLDPTKRWSAAPLMEDDPTPKSAVARKAQHRKEGGQRPRRSSESGQLSPTWGEEDEGSGRDSGRGSSAFSKFVRDSNRLSMQFLGDGGGGKWLEAAERAASDHQKQPPSVPRKEPLGANSSSPIQQHRRPESDAEEDEVIEYVVLRNEEGPLGIHVVPDYDRLGQDRGLLVQGIEPGGRIDQDGRLGFCDRIIEINGHNLLNMPFQTVQEIFRDSLRSPELRLRVVKYKHNLEARRPPPPVFPNKVPLPATSPAEVHGRRAVSEDRDSVSMVEGEEKGPNIHTKVATVSPTKKVPSSAHPASRNANILITANTRKIGKKLEIELVKGPHGLGFSITTRDNPAGGNCPIYIKNILPKGAAVEDGRLKPGDRLLEVNGVAMTGKTQSEAVATLRTAVPGSTVSLVVSRQEKGDESPRLPRELSRAGNKFETYEADSRLQLIQSEPPEKANDDGLIFPWKHREVVTFDIPVHDTEKAGLGVSVKGKTTAAPNGIVDLGIFVKSVINGGAASRDGRLRTNDQLIDINGASLLGTSNSDAMETLRRGMHQEGPTPGVITLTVARRVSSTQNLNISGLSTESAASGRDSANSLLSSSSGTEVFGYRNDGEGPTPENSCASETSENTVIFLPKMNGDVPREGMRPPEQKVINPMDPLANRNPVLDRLTGHAGLRNESYYRATNDSSWNANLVAAGMTHKFNSPTLHCPNGETLLIEDEYSTHQIVAPNPRRPDKINISPQVIISHKTPENKAAQEPQTPSTPGVPGDITYASQTSLEQDAALFSRDAFGRQSMSEKRHASLDAKNTDTYQRNKKAREEREKHKHPDHQDELMNGHANGAKRNREYVSGMYRAASVESIISMNRSQAGSECSKKVDLGPGLGMKKSSSLESLQTMVQEIQMQEDGEIAYTYRGSQGPVKVIRGRGCNESFRAAVDRSYEAPLGEMRSKMETPPCPAREHIFLPPLPPPAKPRERAIDVYYPAPYAVSEEEAEIHSAPSNFGRGGARQSSLNSALDNKYGKKDAKKKAGLFKGIGSMFRFGKHRKGIENPLQNGKLTEEAEEIDAHEKEREREAARMAAQDEQQRIREQYQRLMQTQKQNELLQQGGIQQNGLPYQSPHQQQLDQHNLPSRSERIHQLRAQHQRKHVERRGQYPLDEREERYEQVIRQRLETPPQQEHHPHPQHPQQHPHPQHPQHPQHAQHSQLPQHPPHAPHPQQHPQHPQHHRNPSYDLYGERPGSRMGDPTRYSHYVNYEEIQHHLSKRSEQLSEQQIIQMRQQVQLQRVKVEAEDESRRQMHYHSQRRDPREVTQQRPVSNFFEYESVIRAGQHPMLHPVHHQPHHPSQHFLRDANANSLPRKERHDVRNDFGPQKQRGQFGSIQPHQQYPSPDNNNFSAKPVHYVKQQRLPPDSYVAVHRSSGRLSNGFSPHSKMPPGSKV